MIAVETVIPVPPLSYRPELLNPSHDLTALTQGTHGMAPSQDLFLRPTGNRQNRLRATSCHTSGQTPHSEDSLHLLDCFVDQTEKNLAAMFRGAEEEAVVFQLDEADSYLQDRTSARWSWQVTEVNELLKQMEQFDGLSLCAMNLMGRLDPAVLRRFDLKMHCPT